jgi:hypothetical protein
MPADGQVGQSCFRSLANAAWPSSTHERYFLRYLERNSERYSEHNQDTLTLRILFTSKWLVPRYVHRPPAISLRTNHLFQISSLAQSG